MKTLAFSIIFMILSTSLYGKNSDFFLMAGGNIGLQTYYEESSSSFSSYNRGLLAGARYNKFELFFSWDVTDNFYSNTSDGPFMDAANYNLNLSFRLIDKKLIALSTGISAGIIKSEYRSGGLIEPVMETIRENNTYYPVGFIFNIDLKLTENGTGIFTLLRMPFNEPFWSFHGGVKIYLDLTKLEL